MCFYPDSRDRDVPREQTKFQFSKIYDKAAKNYPTVVHTNFGILEVRKAKLSATNVIFCAEFKKKSYCKPAHVTFVAYIFSDLLSQNAFKKNKTKNFYILD